MGSGLEVQMNIFNSPGGRPLLVVIILGVGLAMYLLTH